MKFQSKLAVMMVLSGVLALSLTLGCDTAGKPTTQGSQVLQPSEGSSASATAGSDEAAAEAEHGHKDGQHGGIIVSLGRDSYHVEAVVGTDGQIRLFTLGKDETRVIDVEAQTLKGYVRAEGEPDAQELAFEPAPQEGDAPNRTSLFMGKLPNDLVGRNLDITIPNMRIEGERFRLGFQTNQSAHTGSDHTQSAAMPDKVANDAEKELYLTPGGHYTAADIVANGNMTASQKFKGIKSDHNMHPKSGDPLCPISGTKANPKFTWVIGGKPFQFCCPPCVDEFLGQAKSSSEPLPAPESFVKP